MLSPGYIYSNGIHKADIEQLSKDGFLNKGKWAHALSETATSDTQRGELVFRGECMSCHTIRGYRSMQTMLGARDEDAIVSFLQMLQDRRSEEKQLRRHHATTCRQSGRVEESGKISRHYQ